MIFLTLVRWHLYIESTTVLGGVCLRPGYRLQQVAVPQGRHNPRDKHCNTISRHQRTKWNIIWAGVKYAEEISIGEYRAHGTSLVPWPSEPMLKRVEAKSLVSNEINENWLKVFHMAQTILTLSLGDICFLFLSENRGWFVLPTD